MITMTRKQTYTTILIALAFTFGSGCAADIGDPDTTGDDQVDDPGDGSGMDDEDDADYEESEPEVTAAQTSTSQVCIYEKANYEGKAQCWGGLRPGSRATISHLFDSDVGNDQVSSFKVKGGVKVKFYPDVDAGGFSYNANGYFGKVWDPDMSAGGKPVRNDDVSSLVIEVQKTSAGHWDADEWQLCLYEHANYGGKAQCFGGLASGHRATMPTIFHDVVGNDQASSYKVNRGVKVTFFRDVNRIGTGYVSDGQYGARGAPDMGATPVGNDSLSSLALEAY